MCIAYICDICGEESSWMMCFRCCMIFWLFPFSMARSDRLCLQPGWDTLDFRKFPTNANWTPRCHDSWSEIRISTRKKQADVEETSMICYHLHCPSPQVTSCLWGYATPDNPFFTSVVNDSKSWSFIVLHTPRAIQGPRRLFRWRGAFFPGVFLSLKLLLQYVYIYI